MTGARTKTYTAGLKCGKKDANWSFIPFHKVLSLEEFIAKLRILVKEANYPVEHNDRVLRDFLVLGMNSDHVRKDSFKVGNALTFNVARGSTNRKKQKT